MNSYFSHDSNARNSEKMIRVRMKYGAEGYGIYFMILERLRDEANYMSIKDYNVIAFDLRVDASIIKAVVEDFGLFVFTEDGKYFYSEGFNKRMAIKDEKSKRRSEAGKKGAKNRWNKNSNAMAMPSEADSNAKAKPNKNDSKESKVKESKDNLKEPKSDEEEESKLNQRARAAVFDFWKELWGKPNAVAVGKLGGWVDTYGLNVVQFALQIAGEAAVAKPAAVSYLTTMFEDWDKQNVISVDNAKLAVEMHNLKLSGLSSSEAANQASAMNVADIPDVPIFKLTN